MNQPLSEIPQQEIVTKAVRRLREHAATFIITEKEADVPWQVGKSFKTVMEDYQTEYAAEWEAQVGAVWGQYVRALLRKWGYGENYLHVGNLDGYWMSFLKAALSSDDKSGVDAVQYSRAVHCNDLQHLGTTDVDTFLKIAKEDWNIRACMDAASYVCAAPQASEEQIRASGYGDTAREFLPRVFPKLADPALNWDNDPEDEFHGSIGVLLEIGCGFGRMTQFMSLYCKQMYAVDISGELLAKARERMKGWGTDPILNVEFLETDGQHLNSIPDSVVDVAFEYTVFQHTPVEDVIVSYIREVGRVLKPGGLFYMQGRDVLGADGKPSMGNTWHGVQVGSPLVLRAIEGTALELIKVEGVSTDRYWATLQKRGA